MPSHAEHIIESYRREREEKQRACILLAEHGIPLPKDNDEWVRLATESGAPEEYERNYELIAAAAISKEVTLRNRNTTPASDTEAGGKNLWIKKALWIIVPGVVVGVLVMLIRICLGL